MTYHRLCQLRDKAILKTITPGERTELKELEKPTSHEPDKKRPWWHSMNTDKREFAQALDGFLCFWFSELRCNRNYRTRDIFITTIDVAGSVKSRHQQLDRDRVDPDPFRGMMTNTEVLFFVLGKQGGTIHQLARILGVEQDEILYADYDAMQKLCRLAQQRRD